MRMKWFLGPPISASQSHCTSVFWWVYLPIYIYILFLSNHFTIDMSLYVMLVTEKFGSPVMCLAKFYPHAR